MKTAIVFSQNAYPSSLADSIRIKPIIECIIDRGYNVELITTTVNANIYSRGGLLVKVIGLFKPNNSDTFIVRLFKEITLGLELFISILFSNKKDVYILTSPPFITCFIGSLGVVLRRGKLIFDVRDIYPTIYVSQKLIKENGLAHKFLTIIERFIYNSSYVLFAATEGLKNSIISRTEKQCFLLRNGYTDDFQITEDKFKKFTIVFHGNLARFQNIELLLDVARKVNASELDIEFVIIGSGPKEKLIIKANLPNVTYYGRLSNFDTAKIVNKSHLGISLRDTSQISVDAFPVKLFEYIGAGIPSISSPIGEGSNYLSKYGCGFGVINNVDEIFRIIKLMYEDKAYYMRIVQSIIQIRTKLHRHAIVSELFDKLPEFQK